MKQRQLERDIAPGTKAFGAILIAFTDELRREFGEAVPILRAMREGTIGKPVLSYAEPELAAYNVLLGTHGIAEPNEVATHDREQSARRVTIRQREAEGRQETTLKLDAAPVLDRLAELLRGTDPARLQALVKSLEAEQPVPEAPEAEVSEDEDPPILDMRPPADDKPAQAKGRR